MATAVQQFSEAARAAGVRDFTAEWADTQRRLATMSTGQRVAQFGYSSIEDDFVTVYDALGQARQRIGKQSDGTFAIIYANGQPPPKPSPPTVSARQLAVVIGWDGTFAGGFGRPGDFARVDVHMSTVSGFVPDGSTVVGSIPAEGVVSIPADNTTHYVRIVAVTTSDVISAPTDEIPVLALPAVEIAAGAVGADQLAATVALLSRLIVGDPLGARLEIEGRDGAVPGMRVYNALGYRTLELDATTGNVTIRGELRTDDAGERIVIAENGSNELRFYPNTGSRFARLFARTFFAGGVDYGAILLAGPTYNGRESYIWTTHDQIQLYRGNASGELGFGGLFISDNASELVYRNIASGPTRGLLHLDLDNVELTQFSSTGGVLGRCYIEQNYAQLRMNGTVGGLEMTPTGLYYGGSGNYAEFNLGQYTWALDRGVLSCNSLASGLYFAPSGVDIYNPANGAPLAIGASAFVTKSARDTKTDIADLPFDPVEVIRAAPARMWERKAEQRDEHGRFRRARKQLGPMADDMPAVCQVRSGPNDDLGIDIGSQLAVAWAATAAHADRLDTLEARLDALETR